MKSTKLHRKLNLNKVTVRTLAHVELTDVAGGGILTSLAEGRYCPRTVNSQQERCDG